MIKGQGVWEYPRDSEFTAIGEINQFGTMDGEWGALHWLEKCEFDHAVLLVFMPDSPLLYKAWILMDMNGTPGIYADGDFVPLAYWDQPERWTT